MNTPSYLSTSNLTLQWSQWSVWHTYTNEDLNSTRCGAGATTKKRICEPCSKPGAIRPWCVLEPLPMITHQVCGELHISKFGSPSQGCLLQGCTKAISQQQTTFKPRKYNLKNTYCDKMKESHFNQTATEYSESGLFILSNVVVISVVSVLVALCILCTACCCCHRSEAAQPPTNDPEVPHHPRENPQSSLALEKELSGGRGQPSQ